MTLDELYSKVTTEILRAEHLDGRDKDAAAAAYRRVSELEQRIAELLPADNEEGAAARRGAVTAALSAGDPVRAFNVAGRYIVDSSSDSDLRKDMVRLQDEALAEVRRMQRQWT